MGRHGGEALTVPRGTRRGLTEDELREARRVFGDAVRYSEVRCVFGTFGSAFGYARTVFHTIYFPRTPSMPWLIHELTHVWQAERIGVWYIFRALWAQIRGGYDYGGEERLRAVRAAGGTIASFNLEQQGEIMADYYTRLVGGGDVGAFEGYVGDVRG